MKLNLIKIYHNLIGKFFGSPKLFNYIKSHKNNYITVVSRPKKSKDYHRSSDLNKNNTPRFAIVIQGRSVIADSFTEETIKIYKKSFNNPTIILATHKGVDSEECLNKMKELGVRVVTIDKPKNCGPFNINLQITSALAGLKEAKKLNFEYAIKTRSDIRFYGVNIEEFLFNILKNFPVKKETAQKSRIISTNIFTLKYRPYSLSDMTIAGHIDDLIEYFDTPLDTRTKIDMDSNMKMEDFVRERPGEIYLETEFLKKKKENIGPSIENSWKMFAERFCVIDQQNLDSYWYKNEHYQCLENKFLIYEPEFGTQDLNFREWLNLYNRFN